MKLRDTFIKPMHPEGIKFVGIFAAVTTVLFFISGFLGWVGIGLTVWCYYFFRDPERITPKGDGLVISPADGVVSLIEKARPPKELAMQDEALTRISIFMSVFDCHVNRSPVTARIVKQAYHPGKFLSASLDKSSEVNERNSLRLQVADGREIAVVQIAGLIARRILSFVTEGSSIEQGMRFGLIRFGSRLDVYLPDGVEPIAQIGQTMIAGETVIADLNQNT